MLDRIGCRRAGGHRSGQWACIAAEADDLLAVIREQAEEERRAKISEARAVDYTTKSNADQTAQKIAPSQKSERETPTKAAELFNTNRTTSPPPAWIDQQLVLIELIELIVAGYRWRAQNRVIKR
jgi:hypothetical protein